MYGTAYDVVLLESKDRVGGNCFTTNVQYGGKSYSIDCGAQFFYKNPQASYVTLLESLGLMDEAHEVISAPAGFTIWDKAAGARRLWIPSKVLGFLHYTAADWDNLADFSIWLAYSTFLDRDKTPDWTLSVDDWFASLHLLSNDFKENVLKPFMYQFVSDRKSVV